MKTCQTCKCWSVWFPGECDKVGNIPATRNPATLFDIYADAADDTGLHCGLKTGPEFGCIHHEEKNETKSE
jgi:hypothetical protein